MACERELPKYPTWLCHQCATAAGKRRLNGDVCTMHYGRCDICGVILAVTSSRNYGHFSEIEIVKARDVNNAEILAQDMRRLL